jgi:hypothetical protein
MRKLITENINLSLIVAGLVLIAGSGTFHLVFFKVELDHLLAEVGALLLVLGILHFFFEERLRQEMLKEVSAAVLGNERLHQNGLADCLMNSKDVKEPEHWEAATSLTLGLQYSPRFIEDYHWLIRRRTEANRPTMILEMDANSTAARYLKESNTGIADVEGGINRIRRVVGEAEGDFTNLVTIKTHDRVLRYSFIRTEESIWIKFYTNTSGRVQIPALKVKSGSPLYEFFNADIQRLSAQ